jgi:hypothetical protein
MIDVIAEILCSVTEFVDVGGEFGELVRDFVPDLSDAAIELSQLRQDGFELISTRSICLGDLLDLTDEGGELGADFVDFRLRRSR